MADNQILPFATGAGANTLAYSAYLTQGYLAQGFQAGVAKSKDFNTLFRQLSTVASGLGQFVANNQSADVLDDGVPANFTAKLTAALRAVAAAAAPAQTVYGATTNGGLKRDGSNNFLLDLLGNLVADNRSAPVSTDRIPIGRTADGAIVTISAGGLGAFVQSLLQQNSTFARISDANSIGMTLANTGDFSIPRGMLTQVPLQAVGSSPIGSVSNGGVLTIAIGGYYVITLGGAQFMSSSGHATDAATFRFQLANSGTGISGPLFQMAVIPPNGGQGAANFLNSIVTKANVGAQIALSAFADNQFHDGNNCGVSGYTNMNVALLNAT